jgi:AraC-like DNA-binding protein
MRRSTPGGLAGRTRATLDERTLVPLLREKSDVLTRMDVSPEQHWPALLATYVTRCRRQHLPAIALYTLLSDLAVHVRSLAERRRLPLDSEACLPASCVREGGDHLCDRFERDILDPLHRSVAGEGPPWEMPRIAAYLDDSCAQRLGLRELARRTGWKPVPLVRAFKRHTGITLHAYLTAARVRRASALLGAGEKVEWVMLQVGYRNRTNFNREFRRITGLAPSEFKRQQQTLSFAYESAETAPECA